MKTYLLYESKTGNTKQLADVIQELFQASMVDTLDEADLVFFGSWTDKGTFAEAMIEQAKHIHHKKVFIFGTCGFGGEAYREQLYERAAALLDDTNQVVGHFYCQGKMPPAVRDRYVSMLHEHPDDQKLQVSVRNFDQALSHPDSADLTALRAALALL